MISGGGGTKPQKDVQNRSPVLFVAGEFVVSEANTGSIGFAQAKDADNDSIRFALSGVDKEYFQIDPISGEISLRDGIALDYDNPQDFDANNIFSLVVTARDSRGGSSSGNVNVRVRGGDDEAPAINGLSRLYRVDEGVKGAVAAFVADDPDSAASDVSWHLDGPDASFFSLSSDGTLALKRPLDFEDPSDQNGDNRYQLKIQAEDRAGNTSPIYQVEVVVEDVWEPTVRKTFDLESIAEELDHRLETSVIGKSDYAALFMDYDGEEDGDLGALVVFADHHRDSAPPGLIVALLDEPQRAAAEQPIWLANSHNQAFAGLAHATWWVSQNGEQHKVVLNSSSYEIEITAAPALFPGKFGTTIKDPPTQHNRRFLANDDGGTKWAIDAAGTKMIETNGAPQNGVLVSTDLKLESNHLYAIGDVTKDSSAEILVYDRVSDQVDVWVWSDDNGSISRMDNNNNPYHRDFVFKNTGLVDDLTKIVHFDVVEGNGNAGELPALLFATTDTAWVLS